MLDVYDNSGLSTTGSRHIYDSKGQPVVPASGASAVLIDSITLNHNQIKQLPVDWPTDPAYIAIPAPGEGKIIVVHYATYLAHDLVADYLHDDGGPLVLQNDNIYLAYSNDESAVGGVAKAEHILTTGNATYFPMTGNDNFNGQARRHGVACINQPVRLVADSNDGLAWTGGDAGTTLVVTFAYSIFDV